MKIALLTRFLTSAGNIDSGIGLHFDALAEALTAEGHAVRVIHATTKPNQTAPTRPWDYESVVAALPRAFALAAGKRWPLRTLLEDIWVSRKVARLVATRDFDVIETHSYQAPALQLLRNRSRPPVFTRVSTTARQVHRFSPIKSRTLRWHATLEHQAMVRSDRLLTHTAHHRDLICADEALDPGRFDLVPHGLPDPGEPPAFSPRNAQHGIEFLYIGRFEPRKGYDVLLQAIPPALRDHPDVTFTLVGSDGDVAWRKFQSANPALAPRVAYLGLVSASELGGLYRRCAVLVAPSRYESFGLVYPEAMARGKPVIGCRAGGIPEVVEDGVTGLLAEPGDVATLLACIAKFAADADLRQRMGAAARRAFLDRFSAAKLARRSVATYRTVGRG